MRFYIFSSIWLPGKSLDKAVKNQFLRILGLASCRPDVPLNSSISS